METERLSAEVKLDLLVGDQQIDLSHTGPDFVIAKQSLECHPGTPAIVAITVNGVRREHAVVLSGAVVAGRKVHYTEPVMQITIKRGQSVRIGQSEISVPRVRHNGEVVIRVKGPEKPRRVDTGG